MKVFRLSHQPLVAIAAPSMVGYPGSDCSGHSMDASTIPLGETPDLGDVVLEDHIGYGTIDDDVEGDNIGDDVVEERSLLCKDVAVAMVGGLENFVMWLEQGRINEVVIDGTTYYELVSARG